MKIIHYLKDRKKYHIIPMSNVNYSTVHDDYREEVTHKGFLLEGEVPSDYEGQYKGHSFGLLFEVQEDIDQLLDALTKMRSRFLEKTL